MGMYHTTYVCTGIKLDEKFSDVDIYDYVNGTNFEDFNSGEYMLEEVVLGVANKNFDCNDGVFEIGELEKPKKEYSKSELVELANKIAKDNDINVSFTEEDIKVYIVPFYG